MFCDSNFLQWPMIETSSFCGPNQELLYLMTETDRVYETLGLGKPKDSVQSNGSV
jgi:hypothetical protein